MNSALRHLFVLVASSAVVLHGTAAEPGGSATPSVPRTSPSYTSGFPLDHDPFDETYQFIFFATLEGLYRAGAGTSDIETLLATKENGGGYLNFIYTCPICEPVQSAILTYRIRPKIDHLKWANYQTKERTFGFGFPEEVAVALRSEKASIRLAAVNNLVSQWISYRMDHSGLTAEQKKVLIENLKKKREEGMKALQSFTHGLNGLPNMSSYAAGYDGDGDECAICNAALQMPLKLHEPPAGK